MDKLGVGVMGSDVHVSGYIKAFVACPDVELIGVIDDDEKTAQDLCHQVRCSMQRPIINSC